MQIASSALDPAHPDATMRSGPPGPLGPGGSASPRRRPHRLGTFLLLTVAVAIAGSAGVLVTAQRQVDRIERIGGLESVLSNPTSSVENFLLVGSDSREGADPSDPDFGGIGGIDDVSGSRSDTIMVLRRDKNGGPAALLSLPRDLWVDIPGRDDPSRINAAYQDGPATLIETVKDLGIPIHHYVEVDFQGFKSLVDAIGGVRIGFRNPARDTHTGFFVETGGFHTLDGVQALAYTRSRFYEEYVDGEWLPDPTSDFGRIKRQQAFINVALNAAIDAVKSNPLEAGDVLVSMTEAIRLDEDLDVLAAASALREAVADGLQTFTPPVRGETIGGNAVLLLGDGAPAVIDYFNGTNNTPPLPA